MFTTVTRRRSCTLLLSFFFQADDGIRDRTVTGVQTCALPILLVLICLGRTESSPRRCFLSSSKASKLPSNKADRVKTIYRSEERRVGKECRAWWWYLHLK